MVISPWAVYFLFSCRCSRNIKCSLIQRNGECVLEVRDSGQGGIRLQAKPSHLVEKEL